MVWKALYWRIWNLDVRNYSSNLSPKKSKLINRKWLGSSLFDQTKPLSESLKDVSNWHRITATQWRGGFCLVGTPQKRPWWRDETLVKRNMAAHHHWCWGKLPCFSSHYPHAWIKSHNPFLNPLLNLEPVTFAFCKDIRTSDCSHDSPSTFDLHNVFSCLCHFMAVRAT